MRKFQDWLNTQSNISHYSMNLFKEAIPCFRIESYRAAFIVSYLGFLICIRDRVLENYNKRPSCFSVEKWNDLISNLQDPDVWEKTILTEINKGSNSVFILPDETRQAMQYWKNERNNAVHGRTTNITQSQVDYFLDFIMKNLSRFYIGGGDEHVKARIIQNLEITTSNIDYSFKSDIEFLYHAYNRTSFEAWIKDVYLKTCNSHILDSMKCKEFWSEFVISATPELFNTLVAVTKNDIDMFLYLKEIIPSIAVELYQDKIFVNKLIDYISLYLPDKSGIDILIDLHKSNIINDVQTDKCLLKFASIYHNHIENILLSNPNVLEFFLSHNYILLLTNHIKSKQMSDFTTAFYNENQFLFIVQFGEINDYIYGLLKLYWDKMYSTSSLIEKFSALILNHNEIKVKIQQYETENQLSHLTI